MFENFHGEYIQKLFVNICQKMLIGDDTLRKEISLAVLGQTAMMERTGLLSEFGEEQTPSKKIINSLHKLTSRPKILR